MPLWNRREKVAEAEADAQSSSSEQLGHIVSADGLKYAVQQGGNDSPPSYQEASGAPVETKSPLGYNVGPIAILFLNYSKMVGTGVYSTPSGVLSGTGSVGLALFYWTLGFFIALAALSIYLEFAANFPNRSGSEVVYLEQAFPRPRYFFPLTFAVQTVILSFSASNAIVLAQYLFRINGAVPTPWQLKGTAVAGYTVAVLLLSFSTKWGYRISNAIGVVKVLTLIFVAITGLVVLGGHTRVQDPHANFRNAFEGSGSGGAYGITNALVRIIFSYAGYENAFNVVNEVKKPVVTIKRNATAALLAVGILYILANIAYFAAVPKADLIAAKQNAASLFFAAVFGSSGASKGLNFLIALSAFGNLLAVLIGHSRMIRECGRQGVIPFPKYWASTWPFGTPLGPYSLKWGLTLLMILAPPAGDAFNFVVDLASYPTAAFNFAMAIGLFLVRRHRKKLGLNRPDFKAWDIALIFTILVNLFLLVMPWYPPRGGATGGNVSFWYATYVVTGIGILIFCALYYVAWIYVLPKLGGYTVRQEIIGLEGGAQTHRLVKVPNAELQAWDEAHDATGRSTVNSVHEGETKL